MRTKQAQYTEFLPATACTPQMRQQLLHVAAIRGESMAEIQRQAVQFFLASFDTDAIIDGTSSIVGSFANDCIHP